MIVFQKRHYKVIAKVLGEMIASKSLIEKFIREFEKDNYSFDRDKFWEAIYKAAGREHIPT